MVTPRPASTRLGDLLLDMRLLSAGALETARREQRSSGRRLPQILTEHNLLDEERLTRSVANRLGIEVIDLAGIRIHERVLTLVPAHVARSFGVLPVAVKRAQEAEVLYLVMADPLDAEALAEVQRQCGRRVRVLMAPVTALDRAIDFHYSGPARRRRGSSGEPRREETQPNRTAAQDQERNGSSPALHVSRHVTAVEIPEEMEAPDTIATRIDVGTLVTDEVNRPASSADEEWNSAVRDWTSSQARAASRPRSSMPPPSKMLNQPWGLAAGLVDLEVDETDDIATKQWDVADVSEEVLPKPQVLEPGPPSLARTLEVPVDPSEQQDNPFEFPSSHEVPVGLEKTAIFPALDREPAFDPPLPGYDTPSPALAGTSDIPYSPEAVEARFAPDTGGDGGEWPEISEVDEIEIVDDASVTAMESTELPAAEVLPVPTLEPPESVQAPVIEPSTLVSLMESEDDPASPRSAPADAKSAGAVRSGGRFDVLMTADGAVRDPRRVSAATGPEDEDARVRYEATVRRLAAKESLSSAERAQVGVAVARLLLDKGLITEKELVEALLEIE